MIVLMSNKIFNSTNKPWKRPWNIEKFDDLYNRDERFFSVLTKGVLWWLNENIVLYNKSIKHFIFNTGSSYLYIEKNGYEYNLTETTGEDNMYMEMPRCLVEIEDIRIPKEELTNPFSRGSYERRDGTDIKGYNAEIRRIPIEMSVNLNYVLSNFNESLILVLELLDKILFLRYFYITYLGLTILCSLEFPDNLKTEFNKIDMTSVETNQKNILILLTICSNYPQINERSEIPSDQIIGQFAGNLNLDKQETDKSVYTTDKEKYIQL